MFMFQLLYKPVTQLLLLLSGDVMLLLWQATCWITVASEWGCNVACHLLHQQNFCSVVVASPCKPMAMRVCQAAVYQQQALIGSGLKELNQWEKRAAQV
jgi:hypothetical protein